MLTQSQISRLANITDNAGQVALAGFVVPFFTNTSAPTTALTGLGISLVLWYFAISLEGSNVDERS